MVKKKQKFKFKVGDIVVRNGKNPHLGYAFGGDHTGDAKKGDAFEIYSRGVSDRSDEILYTPKYSYMTKPNWLSMEENFDLVVNKQTSWKQLLTGD